MLVKTGGVPVDPICEAVDVEHPARLGIGLQEVADQGLFVDVHGVEFVFRTRDLEVTGGAGNSRARRSASTSSGGFAA